MTRKVLAAFLALAFVGSAHAATTPLTTLISNGQGLKFTTGATSAQNALSVAPATSASIGGVKPGQNVTIDPNVGTITVPGVYRGPWAANTSYLQGDLVSYGTTLYYANSAFTSGLAFLSSNWTVAVAPGSGGSSVTIGTTAGTAADASTVLLKTNNLSDLASASTARTNLGLGNAALATIGTAVGNVADGSTVLVKSNNLSDLATPATARTNLGLGSLATLNAAPGVYRGAWAANTAYSQNDEVLQGGVLYAATVAFTSGTTFSASNWTALTTVSSGGASIPFRAVTGTTDTLSSADANGKISIRNASASTETLPSTCMADGFQTVLEQGLAGQITVATPGSSITLASDKATASYTTARAGAQIGLSYVTASGGATCTVFVTGNTQ